VSLDFSGLFPRRRVRTTFGLDLSDACNDRSVLEYRNNFAVSQRPSSIVLARFAKVGMQADFWAAQRASRRLTDER
jgi:hypothetical protein